MFNYFRVIFLLPLLVAFHFCVSAQTPPFHLVIGLDTGQVGDIVCIPVRVQGFTNITGMQYVHHWNPNKIQFTNTQSFILPEGVPFSSFNIAMANSGNLPMTWNEPLAVGITYPDNTVIYEICFEILSEITDRTIIIADGIGLPPGSPPAIENDQGENLWNNETCIPGFVYNSDSLVTDLTEINDHQPLIQNYPNPFSDQITFEVKQYTQPYTLYVYDAMGKRVIDLHDIINNVQLDTHLLPAGSYYWEIQAAQQRLGSGVLTK